MILFLKNLVIKNTNPYKQELIWLALKKHGMNYTAPNQAT